MGKAVEVYLHVRQGEDLFHTMTFAYSDLSNDGALTEHDYDDNDFVLVVETTRGGEDVAVVSVDNVGISTGQSWTTLLPGNSEPTEFTHAILIHIPNSVTADITPGVYDLTLIRTPPGGAVDKSVLGTLTVTAGGEVDV